MENKFTVGALVCFKSDYGNFNAEVLELFDNRNGDANTEGAELTHALIEWDDTFLEEIVPLDELELR